MNSRERVASAMRHEIPDRVPVMCQLALGHYFLHSGHAPADIWFDSEVFVRHAGRVPAAVSVRRVPDQRPRPPAGLAAYWLRSQRRSRAGRC